MDNENNYLSDINVGKINFQPMQKRFMVWDEKGRKFVRGINGHILNWREIANLVEPSIWDCAVELDEVVERFTIVQSTNLFDKDGEEIFEGSIVMYNHNTYFVRQDRYNGMWLLKNVKTGDCSESINGWENGKDERLKLLGHILSSPERLRSHMSKIRYTEDGQIANPDSQLCFEILNHKVDYMLEMMYAYTYFANPFATPHKQGARKPPKVDMNHVMKAHEICEERIKQSVKDFEERMKK